MVGVKFSSVLFLVLILSVMGWFMQSLLGQDATQAAATNVTTNTAGEAAEATGKMRLGIGAVRVLPGLEQKLKASDQGAMARWVAETVEGQLMDALQNTRKFEIVARHDLDELFKEQDMRRGVIIDDADQKGARPGKIKGLQYLVVTSIDDLMDTEQSIYSADMGMAVNKRLLRMSAIVRIYDTTTGVVKESISVPVQMESAGTVRAVAGDQMRNPKASDDGAYVAMVNQLSQRVSQRVVDVIFPAKVIAVTGGYVTLNRGQGTAIDRNQVWEVYAAGRELKDPDTGEALGQEEMKVGEVVVVDVTPKFSKGQMFGENRGIAVGNVARIKMQAPAAAPAGAGQ